MKKLITCTLVYIFLLIKVSSVSNAQGPLLFHEGANGTIRTQESLTGYSEWFTFNTFPGQILTGLSDIFPFYAQPPLEPVIAFSELFAYNTRAFEEITAYSQLFTFHTITADQQITAYSEIFAFNTKSGQELSAFSGLFDFNTQGLIAYEVVVEVIPDDTGTITGQGHYYPDDQVILEANPAEGYDFVQWEDQEGVILSENTQYAFNMPAEDILLRARFHLINHVPENQLSQVWMYPNPAHQKVYIRADEVISQIVLINASGKIVHVFEPADYQTQLSIASLPEGMYIVQIISARQVFTEQLLIAR